MNLSNGRHLAAFAAALTLLSVSPPARAEGLTLADAFERALSSNLSLERARRELPAADAERRAMFSALLPKVAAAGNLGLNSTEVSFGEPPDDRTVLPKQDWDYRVVAVQPLFAGLREKRAYDQSRLAVEGARATGRGAEEDVLLRVATAFAAAAGSEALVDVETRNVALALDGPLDVDAGSALLPPLGTESDLVASALARPDVRQAELAFSSAGIEVKKQRGAYLPVLFAEAGYVKQKRAFPVDEYGYGALRFSVDLFRGGETAARVAAARERETQARLAVEAARARTKLADERLTAARPTTTRPSSSTAASS